MVLAATIDAWGQFVDHYGLPLLILFGLGMLGSWIVWRIFRDNGIADRLVDKHLTMIDTTMEVSRKSLAVSEQTVALQKRALDMQQSHANEAGRCGRNVASLLGGQNQLIRAAQNACDLLERTCPGLKPLVDRIREELEQPKRPS
jgi:hypothetical protein